MKRIAFILCLLISNAHALPKGFVYLDEFTLSIIQEMRYAGEHNFFGRPIKGYLAARCILTKPAAYQLKQGQDSAQKLVYSLKVYDCYRPKMAVQDFMDWSK